LDKFFLLTAHNAAKDFYFTAIDAFNSLPKEISFNLFEIHQANEWWLAYRINQKDYFFDPNRIFSKPGIDRTLKNCNQRTVIFPTEITTQIEKFSDNLLKVFNIRNPSKYIISIHNNTNNGALSLIDFIKSNKYYKQNMYLRQKEKI